MYKNFKEFLFEAKTKSSNYKTLWAAFEQLNSEVERRKIVSEELTNYMHTGGIKYGETWKHSFMIDSLKGKNTRQYLHVQIYRHESGTYELNFYVR